jgi:2-C-methyl-D-erythritol 4-phosphate cytidylyltransferase
MNIVLIVAAGRGMRMGGPLPKQYLELDGISILRRTISNFINRNNIHKIQVIIHPDDSNLYNEAVSGLDILPPVFGGENRQDSVINGLRAISKFNPHKILIHDGVRPFVDDETIDQVIIELDSKKAVIPIIAIKDTIKEVVDGKIVKTIDRNKICKVQTPQGFIFQDLLNAYENLIGKNEIYTDDSLIFENMKIDVYTIVGKESNFKITTKEDLINAQLRVQNVK